MNAQMDNSYKMWQDVSDQLCSLRREMSLSPPGSSQNIENTHTHRDSASRVGKSLKNTVSSTAHLFLNVREISYGSNTLIVQVKEKICPNLVRLLCCIFSLLKLRFTFTTLWLKHTNTLLMYIFDGVFFYLKLFYYILILCMREGLCVCERKCVCLGVF